MSGAELKVAIVTGASSGIGKATAIALAKAGWSVVLFARRAEKLKEVQEQCPGPESVLAVEGDVSNEKDVVRLFEEAVKRFGRVDMIFNNAGISHKPTPLEDFSLETFQNVVNANLIGPFLCTREAFKVFKAQSPQGGRIINNGSIAAHAPRPYATAYTTTKHAITGLTKSTSLDGRRHNITCTQIDIGNADTEMAAGQKAGVLQPDGSIKAEATFDVKHVADAIVHIAGLPLDVTILNFNIMASLMPWIGRG